MNRQPPAASRRRGAPGEPAILAGARSGGPASQAGSGSAASRQPPAGGTWRTRDSRGGQVQRTHLTDGLRVSRQPKEDLLLAYSTNVHPGESLRQVRRSLERYAVPIRDRVFGRRPAGLELRMGIGAARGLLEPGPRERFRGLLRDSGLLIFSINAYPLRDFQASRVKEGVYRPPWTDPARALWTRRIARILADLLEPLLSGSVSTLGGTYRAWGHGPAVEERIARGYLEVVEELFRIEERTGKRIVLAVEPEPDTTFETAEDLISFFEGRLIPAARARWSGGSGPSRSAIGRRAGRPGRARAEEVLRRHFTVNLDTCHLSVVFRRPAEEMEKLARAGISIGKVHVTSALALRLPGRSPRAYGEFRGIREPRYLHQVRGACPRGNALLSWRDLDRLPEDARELEGVAEIRSHFHVPIYSARWGRLRTTREETREAVERAVRKGECRQLVIETYTWPILGARGASGRDRDEALIAGIAREFRWLLGVIAGARGPRPRGNR